MNQKFRDESVADIMRTVRDAVDAGDASLVEGVLAEEGAVVRVTRRGVS